MGPTNDEKKDSCYGNGWGWGLGREVFRTASSCPHGVSGGPRQMGFD